MSETSSSHGPPPEGLECMVTMEDITLEDGNYAEYQCYPSMTWKPALFEASVLEKLRQEQFTTFVHRVKTTDCQAELRRLLSAGPPIYVSDQHGLPMDENDSHIVKLWYCSDGKERSAKLEGAVEDEERQKLWDELKQFIIIDGKESDDEEDVDK